MSPPVFGNSNTLLALILSSVTAVLGLIFGGMGFNDQLPPVAQNTSFAVMCAGYLFAFNLAFIPLKMKPSVDTSPRFYAWLALLTRIAMLAFQSLGSAFCVLYMRKLEAVRSENDLIPAMINLVAATALFSAMTLGSMLHPTLDLAAWVVKNRKGYSVLPM